jgi:hypothetical protein
MTIAEKRKVENLPFIEGTDRIFLNTATLPLDAIDAQAAALGAPAPADAADAPLAPVIPLSVARSVLGRLAWQRSLSEVDVDAVTDGLDPRDADAVTKALDAELTAGGSVSALRRRLSGMGVKMVRLKAPAVDDHRETAARVLRDFFARQGEAVASAGRFDKDAWDKDLAAELHAVAVAVSASVGKDVVRGLGFDSSVYDIDRTVDFLHAVSARIAGNVNQTTADQLEAADDPSAVFATAAEGRAAGIGVGLTTMASGFGVVEAGRRIAEREGRNPTKTWVTGQNPRPEHAALNGQSVPIDEPFSNGGQWPGDDGQPGCNCTVEVSY